MTRGKHAEGPGDAAGWDPRPARGFPPPPSAEPGAPAEPAAPADDAGGEPADDTDDTDTDDRRPATGGDGGDDRFCKPLCSPGIRGVQRRLVPLLVQSDGVLPLRRRPIGRSIAAEVGVERDRHLAAHLPPL